MNTHMNFVDMSDRRTGKLPDLEVTNAEKGAPHIDSLFEGRLQGLSEETANAFVKDFKESEEYTQCVDLETLVGPDFDMRLLDLPMALIVSRFMSIYTDGGLEMLHVHSSLFSEIQAAARSELYRNNLHLFVGLASMCSQMRDLPVNDALNLELAGENISAAIEFIQDPITWANERNRTNIVVS